MPTTDPADVERAIGAKEDPVGPSFETLGKPHRAALIDAVDLFEVHPVQPAVAHVAQRQLALKHMALGEQQQLRRRVTDLILGQLDRSGRHIGLTITDLGLKRRCMSLRRIITQVVAIELALLDVVDFVGRGPSALVVDDEAVASRV